MNVDETSTTIKTISRIIVMYALWHYRLWNFQDRDTKLERFLHKNQL